MNSNTTSFNTEAAHGTGLSKTERLYFRALRALIHFHEDEASNRLRTVQLSVMGHDATHSEFNEDHVRSIMPAGCTPELYLPQDLFKTRPTGAHQAERHALVTNLFLGLFGDYQSADPKEHERRIEAAYAGIDYKPKEKVSSPWVQSHLVAMVYDHVMKLGPRTVTNEKTQKIWEDTALALDHFIEKSRKSPYLGTYVEPQLKLVA